MNKVLDAFWRACVYCLHPRVMALSVLPVVLMAVLSLGLAYFFWDSAVEAMGNFLGNFDLIGIVTVHDGAPIESGEIIAPEVGNVWDRWGGHEDPATAKEILKSWMQAQPSGAPGRRQMPQFNLSDQTIAVGNAGAVTWVTLSHSIWSVPMSSVLSSSRDLPIERISPTTRSP